MKMLDFLGLINEIVENARERAPADAPIRQYLTFHFLVRTAGGGVEVTYDSSWRDFVLRLKTFLREHTSTSTGAAPLLPLEGGEQTRHREKKPDWNEKEREEKMKELIAQRPQQVQQLRRHRLRRRRRQLRASASCSTGTRRSRARRMAAR
jgi:hypothetical protein